MHKKFCIVLCLVFFSLCFIGASEVFASAPRNDNWPCTGLCACVKKAHCGFVSRLKEGFGRQGQVLHLQEPWFPLRSREIRCQMSTFQHGFLHEYCVAIYAAVDAMWEASESKTTDWLVPTCGPTLGLSAKQSAEPLELELELSRFNASILQAAKRLEAVAGPKWLQQATPFGTTIFSSMQHLSVSLGRLAVLQRSIPLHEQNCVASLARISRLRRSMFRNAHHMLEFLNVQLSIVGNDLIERAPSRMQYHRNLGLWHATIIGSLLDRQVRKKKTANVALKMVELGVRQADNAETLLHMFPNLRFIGIDPYSALDYADDADHLYGAAVFRLMSFSHRAHIMRATSDEAAEWIQDGSLDLIFQDGLHDAEGVYRDLQTWSPKLRSGGTMVVHDYGNAMNYDIPGDDVMHAVHRWFLRASPSIDGTLHVAPDSLVVFWNVH